MFQLVTILPDLSFLCITYIYSVFIPCFFSRTQWPGDGRMADTQLVRSHPLKMISQEALFRSYFEVSRYFDFFLLIFSKSIFFSFFIPFLLSVLLFCRCSLICFPVVLFSISLVLHFHYFFLSFVYTWIGGILFSCSYTYVHLLQVEMYTGEVDEDEIMAVEGQDGNQYVVLEVIQLQVRSRAFYCCF